MIGEEPMPTRPAPSHTAAAPARRRRLLLPRRVPRVLDTADQRALGYGLLLSALILWTAVVLGLAVRLFLGVAFG